MKEKLNVFVGNLKPSTRSAIVVSGAVVLSTATVITVGAVVKKVKSKRNAKPIKAEFIEHSPEEDTGE